MIGPGTGIAPFMAFLEEREYKLSQKEPEATIALIPCPYILYFGCRYENGDFIYKDRIRQYENDKIIDKLYLAFSRDNVNS